jgi:hypothetical protein
VRPAAVAALETLLYTDCLLTNRAAAERDMALDNQPKPERAANDNNDDDDDDEASDDGFVFLSSTVS